MKIHDDKTIHQAVNVEVTPTVNKSGENFKQALADALVRIEKVQEKNPLIREEVRKVNEGLQKTNVLARSGEGFFIDYLDRKGRIKKVDHFLDLLDIYVQALSDPRKTLKDIYPVVNSLEGEIGELRALGESLPDDDALKQIIRQTVIETEKEVIRFNRGDYL